MAKKLMRPLLVVLLFVSLTTCQHGIDMTKEVVYQDVLAFVKTSRTGYSVRKAQCITNSAARHNLDLWTFAKLGMAESSFDSLKTNWNNTCFGKYQIHTNHWSHLPYRVFDRKYAKLLKKHNGTNLVRVLMFIGVNTECGAIVLRDALDRSGGDYYEALERYGGWRGEYGRRYPERKDRYLKKILE